MTQMAALDRRGREAAVTCGDEARLDMKPMLETLASCPGRPRRRTRDFVAPPVEFP
jgi:hypothetical protein